MPVRAHIAPLAAPPASQPSFAVSFRAPHASYSVVVVARLNHADAFSATAAGEGAGALAHGGAFDVAPLFDQDEAAALLRPPSQAVAAAIQAGRSTALQLAGAHQHVAKHFVTLIRG